MDADLALVIGLIIGVFAIPAVVSAMSDRRSPRVAAFAIIVAGALIVWAVSKKPGGYPVSEIPQVIVKVVGRYIN